MTNKKDFLGRGWSFPPRFGAQGLVMVSAEEDIRESLLILLSTVPGERVMQPQYGCGLKMYVFEHINETTLAVIRDLVGKAILFFEPRVIVERIDISFQEKLDGKLNIHIQYLVRSTNNRYNLVYPFYFSEATNAIV